MGDIMLNRNPKAGVFTNSGWGLSAFTDDDLQTIHAASLELFQDVGVKIENEKAAEIFLSSSCKAEKKEDYWIVKIPPFIVEDCIRSAPHQVVLKGRTPDYDYSVDPKRVSFTTFGELTKIIDLDTREIRQTTQKDAADIARLCDSIDEIKIIHRPVGSFDKPFGTHPIYNAQALFANTGKHINIGPINELNLRTIAKMNAVHVGGMDQLAERTIFTTIICPSSPLRLEKEAADMVIASAEIDGCGIVAHPVPLAGGTNPITLAGMAINQNVEALIALILAQLVRKGTRTMFGTVSTVMDMRTMTTPFGAPEMGMLSAAAVKMAQYYGLPSIVPGSHSDSKVLDPQIGYESAIGGLLSALAGANFVYGLGTLEDALTFDYAKFMMDVEMAKMVTHIIGGIRFTHEQMALDATREVGPGGDFLSSNHTLEHMRDYFQPSLFDRNTRDTWEALEVKDLNERAYAAAKQRLESHVPEAPSEDVQKQIIEIIDEYHAETGI
jgi:trimethylamine--corrinoid protein Co-methyltransferase